MAMALNPYEPARLPADRSSQPKKPPAISLRVRLSLIIVTAVSLASSAWFCGTFGYLRYLQYFEGVQSKDARQQSVEMRRKILNGE